MPFGFLKKKKKEPLPESVSLKSGDPDLQNDIDKVWINLIIVIFQENKVFEYIFKIMIIMFNC